MKLKVLSLFSGIGGIDKGLEETGFFETVAFCEIDKACHKVLKKQWPNVPIFTNVMDVGTCHIFHGEDYLQEHDSVTGEIKTEIFSSDIDVIVGGFPCQDISFAGNRKGILEGDRSSLWKEYARLIKEVRPKYVIIENVEYLRKNGLGVVLNDLSRIGYVCEWACLTAEAFGLPHQRKRLFLVSYPSSERFNEHPWKERQVCSYQEWESQTLDDEGKECKSEFVEVREILSSGSVESFMRTRTCSKSAVSSLRRVTDGIPDGVDETRRKARIKQLGNAVVPIIAEYIGEQILSYEARKSL